MLIDLGYVRQDEDHGNYRLGLKLVSLALINLSTVTMAYFYRVASYTIGGVARTFLADITQLAEVTSMRFVGQ